MRAAIAESFERIHRSNLVGMGVLPLQFKPGESAATLGLDGREAYTVRGVAEAGPDSIIPVVATRDDGSVVQFETVCRLDSETDVEYFRHGGILQMVLRQLIARSA